MQNKETITHIITQYSTFSAERYIWGQYIDDGKVRIIFATVKEERQLHEMIEYIIARSADKVDGAKYI